MESPSGVAQSLLALHGDTLDTDFRRAALWRWCVARIPPGVRVLDAGSGTGYMARALGRRGNPTVALEPDATLAAFAEEVAAREALDVRVVRAGLGTGAVRALGRFDRILCLDVLEHVEDDGAAVGELAEALEPGGRLLVSVPALPFLYGRRDRSLGHYRRYSRRSLERALAGTGLRLHELRFWNAAGVLPYFVAERLLKRELRDGLRKPSGSLLRHVLRGALRRLLELEGRTWVPFGLSLLATCGKPRRR